jgi:response regulator RpfG family c-di-GMP phosphodiesterase
MRAMSASAAVIISVDRASHKQRIHGICRGFYRFKGRGRAADVVAGMQTEVRVLYVDDEPTLCRAFARLFASEQDVQVTTTTSPLDAKTKLEEGPFDVVVSDLRMPGMDGLSLLSVARAKLPLAGRLLVSGFADLGAALTAINDIGIDRMLTKPWNTAELVAAVRAAAQHALLARENGRITEELRRHMADLATLRRKLDLLVEERTNDLLHGLVAALDLRDTETQWHSRRVARYARRLAEQLAVPAEELDDVERGAILHDIGKLGVRDAVLRKTGPLDESEWGEMRQHPALGYEILKGIVFLERARLIPLHHQERWDGTGYPGGLKGSDICLGARVFAVVDAYDAITTDRPYRRSQPYEVAREEITRCSGTQFDPQVVEAWLSVPASEWQRIRSDLRDGPASPPG